MRSFHRSRIPILLGLLLLPTTATSSAQSHSLVEGTDHLSRKVGGPQPGRYEVLDNIEGTLVQLATAPIRPLAVAPDGSFWSVNTPANTVERFVDHVADPTDVFPVPWGPVSIAHYVNEAGHGELLVVSRGTWALTRLRAEDGAVLDVVPLGAEPGDVLVDQAARRAFVSCSGDDSVVQIDLTQYASQTSRRYHETTHPSFQCKTPLFLSFGPDGEVLVAPLHSGNNTTAADNISASAESAVRDLYDPAEATVGLPDADLFRILPDDGPLGRVEVVARRTGTILFGLGVHPKTQRVWQLATDAVNQNPQLQNEPAIKGSFVRNHVAIFAPAVDPAPLDPAVAYHSLDPGGALDATTTAGQPFALAFHPKNGRVFVVGMLTDNVLVLDQDGVLVKEWDLPRGFIPRGVVLNEAGSRVYVHGWGKNEIRSFRWNLADPFGSEEVFRLSHDPTPPTFAAGREIFFDAANSKDRNLSCASCHVDAGSDMLVWQLANEPLDSKGVMATQTLVGLERLGPFHWRGERQLDDFNGAFVGLLGAPEKLIDNDLARLEAYLFALHNPANPFQNRSRVIDPSIQAVTELEDGSTPPLGNAVLGQQHWRNKITFQGRFQCNQCHMQPTGTNNLVVMSLPSSSVPEQSSFKPAPFTELWRKQQSTVEIVEPDPTAPSGQKVVRKPFLGTGLTRTGAALDIFNTTIGGGGGDVVEHISAFLTQWDQGLAPAVHFAFHLNAASLAAASQELQGFLQKQAELRNCDIAVWGTVQDQGAPVSTRWFYDRHGHVYRSEAGLPPRQLSDFLAGAHEESNVFIGLPVGMAERFAVDYDMDGLYNAVDPRPYKVADADPSDHTAPTFTVAPHVPWVTSGAGRLGFDTDEPTRATLRYWETGTTGQEQTEQSALLSRTHQFMLRGLRPPTTVPSSDGEFGTEAVTYEAEITVRDLAGNLLTTHLGPIGTTPFPLPPADFDPFNNPGDRMMLHEHVVKSLELLELKETAPGRAKVKVRVGTAFKRGGTPDKVPAARRAVIGRALVQKPGQEPEIAGALLAGANTLVVDHVAILTTGFEKPLELPGPFVVGELLTDANGLTTLEFVVNGVASGDTVHFNIEAVVELALTLESKWVPAVAAIDCSPGGACKLVIPVETPRALAQWDFPTSTEARTSVSGKL